MFKIFFFSLGTGTFFNSSVCFVMGWGGVEDYFMFHGGEVNSGFPTVGRGGATFHFFLFKVWGCARGCSSWRGTSGELCKSIECFCKRRDSMRKSKRGKG